MNDNKETFTTENSELEVLSKDLRQLEEELMPQLNKLGEQIPEIYAGYANITRSVTAQILDVCSVSNRTSQKIMAVAEIGARTMMAYGKYKAAKEHNRLLTKYLIAKKEIARLNLSKVKNLLPKSELTLANVTTLFKKHAAMKCDFSSVSLENISRVAGIQLRVLNMYRMALFLNMLAKYLDKEYTIWLQGIQTTGQQMPDFYTINFYILKELFRNDKYGQLEKAADANNSLKGEQIMLLADQQLFTLAMGDKICKIDLDKAAPQVKTLLELHKGIESYTQRSKPLIDHIENDSAGLIYLLGFLSIAAIICMAIWWLPGTLMMRTVLAITGCIAIIRSCSRGIRKVHYYYYLEGDAIMAEYIKEMKRETGKVETQEIDYNEKNALSESLWSFLTAK